MNKFSEAERAVELHREAFALIVDDDVCDLCPDEGERLRYGFDELIVGIGGDSEGVRTVYADDDTAGVRDEDVLDDSAR